MGFKEGDELIGLKLRWSLKRLKKKWMRSQLDKSLMIVDESLSKNRVQEECLVWRLQSKSQSTRTSDQIETPQ